MRLLAQVDRVLNDEVVTLLANMYGGYLANRQHPGWQDEMKHDLEELLKRMLSLELVEEVAEENVSAERLMALLQVLPDSDGGYTPMMKKGRMEGARQQDAV